MVDIMSTLITLLLRSRDEPVINGYCINEFCINSGPAMGTVDAVIIQTTAALVRWLMASTDRRRNSFQLIIERSSRRLLRERTWTQSLLVPDTLVVQFEKSVRRVSTCVRQ